MQGRLFYFVCFLQEVITNEHVVAMMKAAISETEDIPLFVSKKLIFSTVFVYSYDDSFTSLPSWSVS